MKFTAVKINGFKSFADNTQIDIYEGLTGVVGPNGCGKSNLLDAIRWVMGETSAKKMRGGEMDDVIFAGNDTRPARNICEVSLTLEDEYLEGDQRFVTVTRRLERGQGSSYRMNGKAVRLRDVQTFFQDIASGAGSAAIISQGKVGSVIAAKPFERKHILEDAAGVAGIYPRRNEAESKLRETEENLLRCEDALRSKNEQLRKLEQQARQAERYKKLEQLAHQAHQRLEVVKYLSFRNDLRSARKLFEENESFIKNETVTLMGMRKRLDELGERLQQIDAIKLKNEKELTRQETLLTQITSERQRCQEQARDYQTSLRKLQESREELNNKLSSGADKIAALEKEIAEIPEKASTCAADIARHQASLQEIERELSLCQEKYETERLRLIEVERQKDGHLKKIAAEEKSEREMKAKLAPLEQEMVRITQEAGLSLEELEADHHARSAALEGIRDDLRAVDESVAGLGEQLAELQDRERRLELSVDALKQEKAAIVRSLAIESEGVPENAVIHRVEVDDGWEGAITAVLGQSLKDGIDREAPRSWTGTAAPLPAPAGRTLADVVRGVPEMEAALKSILISEDEDVEGFPDLLPGQHLVTRSGKFWRWDGYRSLVAADTALSIPLWKNRLKQIESELEELTSRLLGVEDEVSALEESIRSEGERKLGLARQEKERARELQALQGDLEKRRSRIRMAGERRGFVQEQIDLYKEQLAQAVSARRAAEIALEECEDVSALKEANAELARKVTGLKSRRDEDSRQLMRLQALQESLDAQRLAAERQLAQWRELIGQSDRQLQQLDDRIGEETQRLDGLRRRLAEAQAQEGELSPGIESTRRSLSSSAAEHHQLTTETASLRQQVSQLKSRVEKKRFERESLNEKIRTSMDSMTACLEGFLELFGQPIESSELFLELQGAEAIPTIKSCESSLQRFLREKEALGGVNLLALEEKAALETEIEVEEREILQLRQSVARLRSSITALNKEAQTKITAAFQEIDREFTSLFQRLFGGGTAHLTLVPSDDPLQFGLEIYARPPGKKMQVLSLLSGGEQALTAIALVFAVFLVNPSPLCILDEIDAPLDDANVDRLCTLMRELVAGDKTRFLVVTHHPMTMANLRHLYGVTMAERGVSKVNSFRMRESAEATT